MLRALGLAVLLAVCGCVGVQGTTAADGPSKNEYEASFNGGKEARAWFATGANHMFEASDEAAKKVIEDLYSLGAVEVRVTDGSKLEESSPGETAATLIAKLPEDQAKRKALLKYEADMYGESEPAADQGYVEFVFD